MRIVLIIYAISWLILGGIFIASKFSKHKIESSDREPWYLYALIIAVAPLVILIIPFLLYDDWKDKKRNKKREEERRVWEEQKMAAIERYKRASENLSNVSMDSFVKVAHDFQTCLNQKRYDKILNILSDIQLPINCSLEVNLAKQEGIGSNSSLYVLCNGVKDSDIWKYLYIKDSPMGIWQAYLLYKAHHSLPCFWHGGYDIRSWIYSTEDFDTIDFISKEDAYLAKKLKQCNFYIVPEIIQDGYRFYVTCCYWNDWGGLKRELVEITNRDGKIAEFNDVTNETLFEYDCGICF